MQDNVRKNTAGSWLLLQIVERVVLTAVFATLVIGFAAGLLVGGISPIGGLIHAYPWWSSLGALGVAGLAYRKVVLNLSRTESRWGRGHAAERRVGDHIEQALVRPGCALAHEVKEALGGTRRRRPHRPYSRRSMGRGNKGVMAQRTVKRGAAADSRERRASPAGVG